MKGDGVTGNLNLDILRELADDISLRGVFANKEFGGLLIDNLHQTMITGIQGIVERTPNLGSKIPLQLATAHPTSLVPFQTTWVKCDATGLLGLYSAMRMEVRLLIHIIQFGGGGTYKLHPSMT